MTETVLHKYLLSLVSGSISWKAEVNIFILGMKNDFNLFISAKKPKYLVAVAVNCTIYCAAQE